jgi:hypothetical protein
MEKSKPTFCQKGGSSAKNRGNLFSGILWAKSSKIILDKKSGFKK